MKYLEKHYCYLFIIIFSFFIFHFVYGIQTIDPTNINWLMSAYHDWGTHYLGWAFYRNEPWVFPIGNIDNYNYPAGTNIGLTDSIPLLAILFKSISFLLPHEFQYFGIWLYLCFFLNGLYSFKIFNLFIKKPIIIILLSSIFIIINPVLLYRGMHPALCGHWLILASIYNYLKNSNNFNALNINKNQIILLLISAGINPYLFLMIVGFNFIIPIKHYYFEKTISIGKAIFFPLIAIIFTLIFWFLTGIITFNNDKGLEVIDSYGLYGYNLNNFYNSGGYSKFLPQFDWTNHHQYEGFAYLGIGMIVLIIVVIVLLLVNNNINFLKKKLIPLYLLVLLSVIFAITNKISLNSKVIFEYTTFDIIKKTGNIFRASGRFIWLFYYLIFLGALVILLKVKISNILKSIILILLVFIQIYDISTLLTFRDLPNGKYQLSKFDKEWFDITSKFNKIITYPPFQYDLATTMDYQDLCYLALKSNIPITCGYVARESGNKNFIFTNELSINLAEGEINNKCLYITTQKHIEYFFPAIYRNKLEVKFLNGYYLIFKGDNSLNFSKNIDETKTTDSIKKIVSQRLKIIKVNKPKFSKNQIKSFIEQFKDYEIIQIKGWAFLNRTKNNLKDSIFILMSNSNQTYLFKTKSEFRKDITSNFHQGNLDNSGFRATIFKNEIKEGVYDLSIGIKDEEANIIFENVIPKTQVEVKPIKKTIIVDRLPNLKFTAKGNIDLIDVNNGKLTIRGWSIIPKSINKNIIKVILSSNKINYLIETDLQVRKDITNSLKDGYNYDNSGFILDINKSSIKKGDYNIIILIEGKKSALFNTKTHINID